MNGENGSRPTIEISVIDPLSRAIEWTRDVLFRPFDLGKWLVLGFCAWLAMLADGGGGGSGSWHGDGRGRDLDRGLHEIWEWILAHLVPVLLVAGIVLTLVAVIWLLLLWLSSRGKFIFLDGVVNDRAAVVEPWRRFRAPANSLFAFRVVVGLAGLAAVVVVLTLAALLVWLRIGVHEPDPALILILIFVAMGIAAIVVTFALIGLAIDDFLVPLMYLRDCGAVAAWRELVGLLAMRPGMFVLYVLVRIVMAIVLGVIGLLACCLTCCCVLLPYAGTVILLPLFVFRRAYSLYFLGQFGPPYARFAVLGPRIDPQPGATDPEGA